MSDVRRGAESRESVGLVCLGEPWGMRWGVGFTFSVGLTIMKGCDFGRGGVGLSRGAELSGSGVDLGYAVCLKRGWTGSRFGPEFIFREANGHYQKAFPSKTFSWTNLSSN